MLQSTKRGAAKHINSKIVVCVCVQVNMDDADDVRCSELHVFNCSLFFVHYAELGIAYVWHLVIGIFCYICLKTIWNITYIFMMCGIHIYRILCCFFS